MIKNKKVIAAVCALAVAAGSFGWPGAAGGLSAAKASKNSAVSTVTADTPPANAVSAASKTLQSGKKAEGILLPGEQGHSYQIVLKSSGKLMVCLEGENLAGVLTDRDGKNWDSQESAKKGIYVYQLKKGTYSFLVGAAKGVKLPQTGLAYSVTAKFYTANAKFENNTVRKKAAKLPLGKVFYGHLAQNAPEEYYKVTFRRMSYLAISINTQILEETPETFVVTLYNHRWQKLSSWENPDWITFRNQMWEQGGSGDWIINDDNMYEGLQNVLEAGTYYIGISVKKEKNGRIPASARYGHYAVHAEAFGIGVSLELSQKTAEYTGKNIKIPDLSMKEYPLDPYYDFWAPYDIEEYSFIYNMSTRKYVKNIRKIGRYRIGTLGGGSMYNVGGTYAYAVFTVTPAQGGVRRLVSKKPGQIEISLKRDAPSSGYQIEIARDKKFKKSRQCIKTSKIKETVSGLSSGKKYYVKIRNFKNVKTEYLFETRISETIYGKWSKTKTVVCK